MSLETASAIEELRRKAFARQWWHRIDLGHGIITPGLDDSPFKLAQLNMPLRLDGWTVIDVGAWDGFFSFEAERRGAKRVLATDYVLWTRTGMESKEGFDIAKLALNSRVEEMLIRVEDLSSSTVGQFDLVLFLGVLYHAENPMLYLRNIHSICKRMAIVETVVDALDYPRPAAVFYPGSTLNNDPSNFWGPNRAAVEAMLQEVGFKTVKYVNQYGGNRMVFHAWV
jgi:tRNA (mo5U34)-methyltransferase